MSNLKATMTIVVEPNEGADPTLTAAEYAAAKVLCQELIDEECTYDDTNHIITRVKVDDNYVPSGS